MIMAYYTTRPDILPFKLKKIEGHQYFPTLNRNLLELECIVDTLAVIATVLQSL